MKAIVFLALAGVISAEAQQVPGPSFRDVIGLKSAGAAVVSPDGRSVAYTIRSTEWADNRFDTEIWLWRQGQEAVQLTRTPKGSSTNPRWSPDGKWIGFLADRGDHQQLYLINAAGGEAMRLTNLKDGVADFRWAPDGKRVALLALEPESEALTKRKSLYGEFAIEDQEYRQSHLWLLDVDPTRWSPDTSRAARPTRLTEGANFTVANFAWSPDGARIAFQLQHDPMITSMGTADISIVTVADRTIKPLVSGPGMDANPIWSPDGQWIAYSSSGGDTTSNFYKNGMLMKVSAAGGAPTRLAPGFDEQIGGTVWTTDGIWFGAWQKTKRGLFRVDPATGHVTPVPIGNFDLVFGADFSPDGHWMAIGAQENAGALGEVYRVEVAGATPTKITDLTAQLSGWNLGTSEVVKWPSRDGTIVEGVLHKPKDFTPGRRYPLFVVIHGGPTGVDYPQPTPFYVYPIPEWVAKGAIVLRPNYRGSAGYGEKFRSLNVRNLGVGDLWDVMSGVDYLIKQGIADSTKMAAMGWSQGGYISAFLTTNTNRFKAISVGAGISNWVTYYVATDIHPFTRQYLQATPWNDMAIYQKTSPMTTIKQAKTPTLIQHGEFDTRVPTQNGLELFQGLEDQGVPTKLIIYKGFGHGISKPKEELAAAWHNWQWFGKWVFGETIEIPLDDPAAPAVKTGGR